MANNNLATIPEFWAREGLVILTESIGSLGAVNRQFEATLAKEGDTVNAHRAARQKIQRKTGTEGYTASDVTTEDVPVRLDQLFFKSFIIRDHELSLSSAELVRLHLIPAMQAIARGIDRAVLGRVHEFLRQGEPTKRAGSLEGINGTTSSDYLLEAQQVLNVNNAPDGVKNAIVGSVALTGFQKNLNFITADKVGDAGETLRTGLVGQVYNTRIRHSQNANYVYKALADIEAKAVEAGQAAGYAGAIATVDFVHTLVVGEYIVFNENGQPTYITVTDGVDAVTLNEPLKNAITTSGTATVYFAGANEAVERLAGYSKEMLITHTSGKNLQVGQLLSFGTTTRYTYTIIEATVASATTTSVLLDRPLDATVASAAACFPGPGGGMNLVMHTDALALVTRPLVQIDAMDGARSAVMEFEGLGLRVVTQYDSSEGGLRVNIDILAGVAVLDRNLACVMLS